MQCLVCGAVAPDTAHACPACGSPLGSQTLAGGTLLQGKYRIDGVLGQGGFGITYAATQTLLGSKLAIKEMFPLGTLRRGQTVHPPTTFDLQTWKQAKHDFTEEARTLARFNHPDIVRVLDLFEEGGSAYMVMERLSGETLQARLNRLGTVPPDQVRDLAVRTTQALQLVHDAGLLHRDLKPDNIFLEASGRIVLIDFGAARVYTAGKTVQYTRLVTPGYAPPEQYGNSARFAPYTDIYALGATLYHALSGQMPPAATDLMLGTPLPALPASVPIPLRQAVEKMMAIRVADRPQDAAAVLSLLGSAAPLPQSHPQPTPQQPLPPAPALPAAPTKPALGKTAWPLIVVALLAAGGYKQFFSHPALAAASSPTAAPEQAPTSEQPASTPETPAPVETPPPADTTGTSSTEAGTTEAGTTEASNSVNGQPFTITTPAADANLPAGDFDFSGTGAAGEPITIFQDGTGLSRVTVASDGTWTSHIPSPAAGPHTYSVKGANGTELGSLDVGIASPQPATVNEDPITSGEVQTLVDEYLQGGGQDDLAPAMRLYADKVDYFDRGFQPKEALYTDKHNYFMRWPTRAYQRTSGIATLADRGETKQVRFDYYYDILRPDKEVSGTAYTVLSLIKKDGQLLIEGEKGAIYPRTQVKRAIAQPAPAQDTAAEPDSSAAHVSVTQPSVSQPQPSGAPTFPQWYFTTCADNDNGQKQTGLVLGRLENCSLVIETVPNGAQPTRADFIYELEYPADGTIQKFALETPDHWPPTPQQPTTTLQKDGNNLIFTLPLAVRARTDRRYTSLNVIGKITFDNGSTKQIYEKLPIN